jgi:hypothetical protein
VGVMEKACVWWENKGAAILAMLSVSAPVAKPAASKPSPSTCNVKFGRG